MIFRDGFQSYDFQLFFELPKPLTFASQDDALKWLKQFISHHPDAVLRFREYTARLSDNLESFKSTDQDAIEGMAALLYARKLAVIVRREAGGATGATAQPAQTAPAFPLSEHRPREASVALKPAPVSDPPTFDAKIDPVLQAGALVAAAAEGRPFCPE